jgi:hypothetical protein
MLKIKDNVDLKELEKFGFEKDSYSPNYFYTNEYDYCYEFLRVDIYTREIFISSGVDEVNGGEELIKFYQLIKNDLIEMIED